MYVGEVQESKVLVAAENNWNKRGYTVKSLYDKFVCDQFLKSRSRFIYFVYASQIFLLIVLEIAR